MGQLIRPDQVRIITKDGELQIHLTLEININLNGDGLNIGKQVSPGRQVTQEPEKEDDAALLVPDFGSFKVPFGQHVHEQEK